MDGRKKASTELEAFIDESIHQCKAVGYHPATFQSMRAEHDTLEAINRLVRTGHIQSGFKKLHELDMLDWSLEAAVLKFPQEFSREIREAAQWRLDQAKIRKPHGPR